jgi:CubicO group peptidase (beta-lactamase class C family)
MMVSPDNWLQPGVARPSPATSLTPQPVAQFPHAKCSYTNMMTLFYSLLMENTIMIRGFTFIVVSIFLLGYSELTDAQDFIASGNQLSNEQVQRLIQESRAAIHTILTREIYLPGLSVALVDRNAILWTEGFGYRDKSKLSRVDTNTIFGVLSVSKTITVTGLMMAVQEGLIDLDLPIRKYLPDFTVHSRFPDDPMSEITLRHLISMTSGLTHDAPLGNNSDPASPSYEDHIRSFGQTWLRFKTGERAEYSGLGIELAGYCLEQVIHKPFTGYIQEKIFQPLGMKRSTYDIRKITANENRATGNNKNIESIPVEIPMLATAGVYSSIGDMARFMRFHLNRGKVEGRTLIKEELMKQMQTIPFPLQDQISGYGQGLWVRYYHLGGQEVRCVEHGGGGFGFLCQMKWLPDLGYGVMVMTNSSDQEYGQERLVEDILLKIVELLTGRTSLGPSDWLNHHVPPRSVDTTYLPTDLGGRYNGTNDDMLFLVKEGRFGYASGNAFESLTPISPSEFISKRYVYRFVRNPDGRPVSVVRPYDGMVWVLGTSDAELKGLDKKEWSAYTGSYVRKRFGVGEKFYNVSVKHGWLHFEGSGQDFRLTEHLPGLFFTPDGEAVDLGSATPTFRNIRLYKVCQ